MLDGLHHVWRAAAVLAGADAGLRERLKLARTELFLSLKRPEQWPAELLHLARSTQRIIQPNGEIDPLDTLCPAMATQVAEDLFSLAADVSSAFEAARNRGEPVGDHREDPEETCPEAAAVAPSDTEWTDGIVSVRARHPWDNARAKPQGLPS